jgi:hypothetical protein
MASLTEFSGPLGSKNVAHLLRRLTFGPTPDQILTYSTLTASEALTTLFSAEANPSPPPSIQKQVHRG